MQHSLQFHMRFNQFLSILSTKLHWLSYWRQPSEIVAVPNKDMRFNLCFLFESGDLKYPEHNAAILKKNDQKPGPETVSDLQRLKGCEVKVIQATSEPLRQPLSYPDSCFCHSVFPDSSEWLLFQWASENYAFISTISGDEFCQINPRNAFSRKANSAISLQCLSLPACFSAWSSQWLTCKPSQIFIHIRWSVSG